MAVMPMKQVLICGMQQDQSAVLADLQQQGVLEIRSLKQEEGGVFFQKDTAKNREEAGQTALLAEQALAVLDQYVPEKRNCFLFLKAVSYFPRRNMKQRLPIGRRYNPWPNRFYPCQSKLVF